TEWDVRLRAVRWPHRAGGAVARARPGGGEAAVPRRTPGRLVVRERAGSRARLRAGGVRVALRGAQRVSGVPLHSLAGHAVPERVEGPPQSLLPVAIGSRPARANVRAVRSAVRAAGGAAE